MQKWFYSWCTYTSNEAGGDTIFKFGSGVVESHKEQEPEKVLHDIKEMLNHENDGTRVHIIAFNKI